MSIDVSIRQQMDELTQATSDIASGVDVAYMPLVVAAQARLTEAMAFIEIAVESREPADKRLARLDVVFRETVQMVGKVVERAGVDLHNGIGIDEVDEFLTRQEQASAALDQARIGATAVVVHLDRALKLSLRT